jgi:hypothetical protein
MESAESQAKRISQGTNLYCTAPHQPGRRRRPADHDPPTATGHGPRATLRLSALSAAQRTCKQDQGKANGAHNPGLWSLLNCQRIPRQSQPHNPARLERGGHLGPIHPRLLPTRLGSRTAAAANERRGPAPRPGERDGRFVGAVRGGGGRSAAPGRRGVAVAAGCGGGGGGGGGEGLAAWGAARCAAAVIGAEEGAVFGACGRAASEAFVVVVVADGGDGGVWRGFAAAFWASTACYVFFEKADVFFAFNFWRRGSSSRST